MEKQYEIRVNPAWRWPSVHVGGRVYSKADPTYLAESQVTEEILARAAPMSQGEGKEDLPPMLVMREVKPKATQVRLQAGDGQPVKGKGKGKGRKGQEPEQPDSEPGDSEVQQ